MSVDDPTLKDAITTTYAPVDPVIALPGTASIQLVDIANPVNVARWMQYLIVPDPTVISDVWNVPHDVMRESRYISGLRHAPVDFAGIDTEYPTGVDVP